MGARIRATITIPLHSLRSHKYDVPQRPDLVLEAPASLYIILSHALHEVHMTYPL